MAVPLLLYRAGSSFAATGVGQLLITALDRTEYAHEGAFRYRRTFNQRSSGSGLIVSRDGSYLPEVGNPVILFRGSVREFAGYITKCVYRPQPGSPTGAVWTDIECTDNNWIADKRLVYSGGSLGVLELGPGYAGDIMTSIANFSLSGESVDVSLVEQGPYLVAPITFYFETVAAAFNKVCQYAAGYRWRIDEYRRLRFSAFDSTAAPFSITASSQNYEDLTVTRDLGNYRNRQFVRTETNLTATKVESFTGDGTTRDFFIGFTDDDDNPVANPQRFFTAEPVVTLDGVALTMGRMGTDADITLYDAMWDAPIPGFGDLGGVGIHFLDLTATIGFAQTPPGVGQILAVTYEYLVGNIVMEEDTAQQLIRQGIEGGSGITENVDEQRNIRDGATLRQIALGDLAMYMLVPKKVDYSTNQQGLEPGMIQPVTLPALGVSATLLVETIESNWFFGRDFQFRHKVTLTDAGPLAGPIFTEEKLREVARIGAPRTSGPLTSISEQPPGTVYDFGGRVSDGSNGNYMQTETNNAPLASSGGPFTIAFWARVDNLAQTTKILYQMSDLGGTSLWQVDFGFSQGAGNLGFVAVGYSGSNPGTGSSITVPDTQWHHYCFRKTGSGSGVWDKFIDGAKTTINAGITFAFGGSATHTFAFADRQNQWAPTRNFVGALADLAIWNVAITDAQVLELATPAAADEVALTGLVNYWPLGGSANPEPDLGSANVDFDVFGTITAA